MLNLSPGKSWAEAEDPLIGITPIMKWMADYYGKRYEPNTRETVRRQTMHQFVDAGIARHNPDDPHRAVNSPKNVYQIAPSVLKLLRSFGTSAWHENLTSYFSERSSLAQKYAREREHSLVPVKVSESQNIFLSSGEHSELIRSVVEEFAPRFAPGSKLVYVGDTGEKWGYFDSILLDELGVEVDPHGKMPDVVLYYEDKRWLLLVEAFTSHGPIDAKRHGELANLFSSANPGLVFVTAFPNRAALARKIGDIAWETEVWIADDPSHLVHFDGERFLGPH